MIADTNRRTPAEQPAPASTGRESIGWVDDNGMVFWKEGKPPADGTDLFAAPVAARELDVEAERVRSWQERCDWQSSEPATKLMVEAMKAEIAELRTVLAARFRAEGGNTKSEPSGISGELPKSAPVSTEQAGDAWISVEDRLPDESLLRFLVTGRAVSGGPLGVHIATLYDGDMYFEGAAESGGCNPCINDVVTHWMPLPGAPSPNNSPVGGKD